MFSVKHIKENYHYTVYSVRCVCGDIEFLIHDGRSWKWEDANLFEPTNYNVN